MVTKGYIEGICCGRSGQEHIVYIRINIKNGIVSCLRIPNLIRVFKIDNHIGIKYIVISSLHNVHLNCESKVY